MRVRTSRGRLWRLPGPVALALGLILAGCGAPDAPDASVPATEDEPETVDDEERAPVTIHILTWEPGGPDYWEATISAFEEKYPWITVEHEPVPVDRYFEKQGAYISSRSGPDVMINNVGLELFERLDAYQPITDRIRESPVTDQLFKYNGTCIDFDLENECYGLPRAFQGNVVYFNRTILEEAGLDPDDPPATWDEFGTACDQVHAIGQACMAIGMGVTIGYWLFPEVARNYFEEDDILAMQHGELRWDDPKSVETLRRMAEMAELGWFQEGAASIDMIPAAIDVFIAEQAAFIGGAISGFAHWKMLGDGIGHENLGVMRWPVIDPGSPLAEKFSGVEADMFGVTAWSDNPDEAWLLIEWLAGPENAELALEVAGEQPINQTFDPAAIDFSPAFQDIQDIIRDSTFHSGVMLSGREHEALSRGYQEIIAGSLDLDQWVEQMNTALDQSGKN